jgi:stage V sporulation protein K
VLSELDELIGIEEVKEKVRQTANFAKMQQMRLAKGLKAIPTSYHAVYTGNPRHRKNHSGSAHGKDLQGAGGFEKRAFGRM